MVAICAKDLHFTFDISECLADHPLFSDHPIATKEDDDEVYCSDDDLSIDIVVDYHAEFFKDATSSNQALGVIQDTAYYGKNGNAMRTEFVPEHC